MGQKEDPAVANHVSGQSNNPISKTPHVLPFDQVVQELQTNGDDGLTKQEAQMRLEQYGRNEFGEAKGVQPLRILGAQLANAMTLILIMAMAASLGIESWIEGGVIAAVIAINIGVGATQEFRAAKTMDSLRSLSSPTASAVRGGETIVIPTVEIVPGDMVDLKTGDTIPADVRLIEALNFETDEALLTGESLPVRKEPESTFEEDTGPGDRLNVAYSSSTVTKGRARGVVFATGMFTEIGQIAAALRGKESRRRPVKRKDDGTAHIGSYGIAYLLTAWDAFAHFLGFTVGTPLQRKLSKFAIILFFIAIICAIIVLAANEFSSKQEVIIYAVATGVSMIPSSLIVVLTITMAAGTKRMVRRHVIVRNLKSLEALGAVTNICSDKTGTLTQGKMVLRKAWIAGHGTYSVSSTNEPFNPTKGTISYTELEPTQSTLETEDKETNIEPKEAVKEHQALEQFLNIGALANTATVRQSEGEGREWHARGDPTEIAIQVFAARFFRNRLVISTGSNQWKQISEFPFDSDVKKMSVIFEDTHSNEQWLFTKGATERLIDDCPTLKNGTDEIPMTNEIKGEITKNLESLARLGLRVLSLASRTGFRKVDAKEDLDRTEFEHDLVFHGLVGIYDPPRAESASSVKMCHKAGVGVHMLTGDHPETARAIAREVGILPRRTEKGWTYSALGGAPDPVRDQIMRHDPRFFTFQDAYLNENVEYDLQNALLGEEQEEELFQHFALAGLTRDPRARRNMVPEEVWAKLPPDPEIQALEQRRDELRNSQYRVRGAECEAEIRWLTEEIGRKNTQRGERIITSHRKHYFQNRSTWDIDRLFLGEGEEEYIEPEIDLQIPERAELARLLRNQPRDLTDEDLFQRRIKVTDLTVALCGKKESSQMRKRGTGNRGRAQYTSRPALPLLPPIKEESPVRAAIPVPEPDPDPFPLLMDPNQCPDCIGDERMTLQERTFRYCRPTIRNDHFDDAHLEERERTERCGEPIKCHHPKCRDMKFQHLDHFRNHVQTVHRVPLRSSDQVKRRREGKIRRRRIIRERRNRETELIPCQG